MQFGIIGYGRFGRLWGNVLMQFGEVKVYDPLVKRFDEGIHAVSLEEVCDVDMLFLLVPISRFERACEDVADKLRSDTIVVDACSVKVHPVEVMTRVLSSTQPIIATHPLFGPDSVARDGIAGQRIVVYPVRIEQEQYNVFEQLLEAIELQIINATPDEHDRQMARSQSLVHFLGRGMAALELSEQLLATPDYTSLVRIHDLVNNDTWELFYDMQVYNPYATYMRSGLLETLQRLDREIAKRRDSR